MLQVYHKYYTYMCTCMYICSEDAQLAPEWTDVSIQPLLWWPFGHYVSENWYIGKPSSSICDRTWENRPFCPNSTFELWVDLVGKLENGQYQDYCTSTKFKPLCIFYNNPGFHVCFYNTIRSVCLGSLEAFPVRERTAIKIESRVLPWQRKRGPYGCKVYNSCVCCCCTQLSLRFDLICHWRSTGLHHWLLQGHRRWIWFIYTYCAKLSIIMNIITTLLDGSVLPPPVVDTSGDPNNMKRQSSENSLQTELQKWWWSWGNKT